MYEAWISECNWNCHIKLHIFNYYYFSIVTGQLLNRCIFFFLLFKYIFSQVIVSSIQFINTPIVLRAVPQPPLSLFNSFIDASILPQSSKHHNFQTVWARKMTFFLNVDQPLSVTFHMSHGIWHMSHVKCHVSHVIGHVFFSFFL